MSVGVILLAAGAGRRFGRRTEKQLLKLNGEPLFLKSLRVFLSVPSVKEVSLVIPKHRRKIFERIITKKKLSKKVHLVDGGDARGLSVRNGFKAFSKKFKIVLVHDSARPLLTKSIIQRVGKAAHQFGVSLAAWPLADTLKFGNESDFVKKTIPREQLWLAQTPQAFRWDIAEKCLLNPSSDATDDVSLAEKKGFRVKLVPGAPFNFKITVPYDFDLCQAFLKK